nr:hypothetical protein Iba_chr07cCG13510 [Ipomoea batatas]
MPGNIMPSTKSKKNFILWCRAADELLTSAMMTELQQKQMYNEREGIQNGKKWKAITGFKTQWIKLDTDGVNGEGGAVRDGGVFTEEDDLVDGLSGGLFPAKIQVVLFDDSLVVLEQSEVATNEGSNDPVKIGSGSPTRHG